MQDTLAAALREIASGPVRVAGAGRTDAGVHAEGQVAVARLETRLDAATLRRALNAKLPSDLAVREAAVAADPGSYEAQALLGRLYRDAGRTEDAIKALPDETKAELQARLRRPTDT